MADIRISNLPTYTADTTGAYLVMNDSGNTTTYKVLEEDVVGDALTYNDLTRITSDMVWDANTSAGNDGGWGVAGGLMYNYTTTNQAITTGLTYGNTIILQPGETLDKIKFNLPVVSTTAKINIGLYSIVQRSTDTGAKACAVGELLHTISTAYTASTTGDKVITSINYTAQKNQTLNNVYFVAFAMEQGSFSFHRLSSNNLIAHIMGGNTASGTYYRTFIESINTTTGTLENNYSTYTINDSTSPGMFFTYKVI